MPPGSAPTLLLYDAGCNFCVWMIALILRRDHRGALRPLAIQSDEAAPLLADLDEERRLASWHAVEPGGRRTSGGDAFPVVLGAVPALAPFAALSRVTPAGVRRWGYRLVAERRVEAQPVRAAGEQAARAVVRQRPLGAC